MSTDPTTARVINQQKGQLIALHFFIGAVFRAMPSTAQQTVISEWPKELELFRTVLLNSEAPDDVADAFDLYAGKILESLSKPRG